MVQLFVLVWIMAGFFAYVGFHRGWSKEVISMSGIILGLFALHQFDTIIRDVLFGQLPPDQKFYGQSIIFLMIAFFAYQTRALIGSAAQGREGRDSLQSSVLGAIVGFVNGYLIGGSIWYFVHINQDAAGVYPLDPFVVAPVPGTPGEEALRTLPLFVLTQGPGSNGDLLSLAVIVLFIIVLVVI